MQITDPGRFLVYMAVVDGIASLCGYYSGEKGLAISPR